MLYIASNRWRASKPSLSSATEREIRDAIARKGNRQVTLCHNTVAFLKDGCFNTPILTVRFHSTDIVEFFGHGPIRLNTGGYHTVTTKQRLNALLSHRGIRIHQKDYEWFVTDANGTRAYHDGMVVR